MSAAILIVFSLGSWFSFFKSSSIAPALIACVGGMIVFLGLWVEKDAEKAERQYPSKIARAVRLLRLQSEIGWMLLMAGIAVEIGDAAWTAVDIWQAKQIAINNGPLKQPIKSLEAFVWISISSTNGFAGAQWRSTASLDFDQGDCFVIFGTNTGPLLFAPFSAFSTNLSNPDAIQCVMRFMWPSPVRVASREDETLLWNGNNKRSISMEELDRIMGEIHVPIPCSKSDVIIDGMCSVIFNGAFERRFQCQNNHWARAYDYKQ